MSMVKFIRTYLLAFIFSIIIAGCDQGPLFPEEPRVAFVDIQPRVVKQFQDSIVVTLRFQDGDGDIGLLDSVSDRNNLILIDSRIGSTLTEAQATNFYTLPNLTPDARNPSIQGEITVKLDFTIKTTAEPEEQVRYQIRLRDRSGNYAKPIDGSDEGVYTDFITVIP